MLIPERIRVKGNRDMNPILRDLLAHQFWADTELWNAVAANAAARTDRAIHGRFHHLHLVQRFFVWAVSDRGVQPTITRPEEYPSLDRLREYARGSHQQVQACIDAFTADSLERPVTIPWFQEPPLTISVTEALTQLAMHSHHHRAQNATRLREIGGEPPPMDLIVWYWKGRPAATL
jgi:uncharacterized damage-inducible protein DinB